MLLIVDCWEAGWERLLAAILRMLGLQILLWMALISHALILAADVCLKCAMCCTIDASSTLISEPSMYSNVLSYTSGQCLSSTSALTIPKHTACVLQFSLADVWSSIIILLVRPSMLLSISILHASLKFSFPPVPEFMMAACMQYRGGYCFCSCLSGILGSPKSRKCMTCSQVCPSPRRFFLGRDEDDNETLEDEEADEEEEGVEEDACVPAGLPCVVCARTNSQSMYTSGSTALNNASLSTNFMHMMMMALMAFEMPSLCMLMVARSHRLRRLEMALILDSDACSLVEGMGVPEDIFGVPVMVVGKACTCVGKSC